MILYSLPLIAEREPMRNGEAFTESCFRNAVLPMSLRRVTSGAPPDPAHVYSPHARDIPLPPFLCQLLPPPVQDSLCLGWVVRVVCVTDHVWPERSIKLRRRTSDGPGLREFRPGIRAGVFCPA